MVCSFVVALFYCCSVVVVLWVCCGFVLGLWWCCCGCVVVLWWRCVGVERYGKLDLWRGRFYCFVVLCDFVVLLLYCGVVGDLLFCYSFGVVLRWCSGGIAVVVCCCCGVVAVLGSMERLIVLCTMFPSFVVAVLYSCCGFVVWQSARARDPGERVKV